MRFSFRRPIHFPPTYCLSILAVHRSLRIPLPIYDAPRPGLVFLSQFFMTAFYGSFFLVDSRDDSLL